MTDAPENANLKFERTPDQLRDLMEQLERRGYNLERLDQKVRTADEKQALIRNLKEIDPTVNGNAENLAEELGLYRQETMAKKEWSTWDYVKEMPKKAWNTMKAHPYITAGIVLALLGVTAYATGYVDGNTFNNVRMWVMKQVAGSQMAGAAEAVKGAAANAGEMAGQVAEKAGAAASAAGDALPTIAVPNVPTAMPPSVDDAMKILDALGKGG